MGVAVDAIRRQAGESITWAIRCSNRDLSAAVVTSQLKRAVNGSGVPARDVVALFDLSPVLVPAAGEHPTYHRFDLTGAQSATLQRGNYITDVRFAIDGMVYYSEPLLVVIEGAVTEP